MRRPAARSGNRVIRPPQFYYFVSGLILLAGMALSLGDFTAVSPWPRIVVALLVFLLPGGCLFGLIPARDSWDLIDIVGYGFSFSIALITVLGLATRTFAWSIDTVESIWYLLAILGFAALAWRQRAIGSRSWRFNAPALVLLTIVILQAALFTRASLITAPSKGDRDRHHAETNSFLGDEPLGWTEPYFDTGNIIADRMYLTYWTLAKALVVEISGAPILISRYFIQPFVLIVSVAAMYVFARNLGHARRSSLAIVSLGLFAFSLLVDNRDQPASHFLAELILDKAVVGFALAPVALSSAYLCFRGGQRRAYACFAISMFAAACTHSLVAGFAVGIIGIWCLIQLIADKTRRGRALLLGALTLAVFSPAIILRATTGDTTIYNFGTSTTEISTNKILVLDWENPLDADNQAYAINPTTAGGLTYILLLLTLVAAGMRRADDRGRFLAAHALAGAVGLIPVAASIYGRLVSVNHIIRVLWLMPYGYMLYYVLYAGLTGLRRNSRSIDTLLAGVSKNQCLIAVSVIALPFTLLFMHRSRALMIDRHIAVAGDDQESVAMAQNIEANHDDRVWVAASSRYRRRVISINWRAISLSRYSIERMSYYSRIPAEQAALQESDNFRLYQADVSVADKLEIIERYGLDYLLFDKKYAWMIDSLYQHDKTRFELVFSGETMRLVRIK